jgi:hypothetical protein
MENNTKKIVDSYIDELNKENMPYSTEMVVRNSDGKFPYAGLSVYDELTNVKELILLSNKEHPETLDDVKFLVVEIYKTPTPDGDHFGVPSLLYVEKVTNDEYVARYTLSDDEVKTYANPVDAVIAAIKNFELDNYQRKMSVDNIAENINALSDGDPFNDEIAGIVLAQGVIRSLNTDDVKLFESSIDLDVPKLVVSCPKYDNWADIVNTGEEGSLHNQVVAFTSENFSKFIDETLDTARVYCLNTLKDKKNNNHKIKPS